MTRLIRTALYFGMAAAVPLLSFSGAGVPGQAYAAEDAQAMTAASDGTFTVFGGQTTSVGSYTREGLLKFKGKDHSFDVSGMSIQGGDAGISAEGSVYNLSDVGAFAGHYSVADRGMMSGGREIVHLKNDKGVTVEVRGTSPSMRVSLETSGVTVSMR